MTMLSYIINIILYCIVLYSIKRDWPPCKVVFRVGNQNTKCDKQQQKVMFCVLLHRVQVCMYRASSVVLSSIYGKVVACSTVELCTQVFVCVVTAVDWQ